jgi:hypothetical protein
VLEQLDIPKDQKHEPQPEPHTSQKKANSHFGKGKKCGVGSSEVARSHKEGMNE